MISYLDSDLMQQDIIIIIILYIWRRDEKDITLAIIYYIIMPAIALL